MTTRAERRAQRATIKARRLRRIEWARNAAHHGNHRLVGIFIDTPVQCSCWMCGNPRAHHGGRTIQERRYSWK